MCLNLIIKDYENLLNYENKINYCFKPYINKINNNKNWKRYYNFKEIENDFVSEISSFGFSPFINSTFIEQRNNKNIFKFYNENIEYGLLNFIKRRFKIRKGNSFDFKLNRNNKFINYNKSLKKSKSINNYFIKKKNKNFNVNKEKDNEKNNYLFNIMKKINKDKKNDIENKKNFNLSFNSNIFFKEKILSKKSTFNDSINFVKEISNSFNKSLFKKKLLKSNNLNKNKILFKEKINEIFKEEQKNIEKLENKKKKKKKIKFNFNRNLNKYLNSTKCSSGFLTKKEINKNNEKNDIFSVAIYQKKCDEYLNKLIDKKLI